MLNYEFDSWKVISQGDSNSSRNIKWRCQCQNCGQIKDFVGTEIRLGRVGKCKCLKPKPKESTYKRKKSYKQKPDSSNIKRKSVYKDEKNKVYEKLTVIEFSHTENSFAYWKCRCECGKEVIVRGSHLRGGQVKSCGCMNSYKEYKIRQILEKNSINFQQEYKFEDLKDKRTLRFDFGILNNKDILLGLIEYQGRQHFTPPEEFNHFGLLQIHDKMKKEYCERHNIPLLILDKDSNLEEDIINWIKNLETGQVQSPD